MGWDGGTWVSVGLLFYTDFGLLPPGSLAFVGFALSCAGAPLRVFLFLYAASIRLAAVFSVGALAILFTFFMFESAGCGGVPP